MLIINSLNEILYGKEDFNNMYGFSPNEILVLINFQNKTYDFDEIIKYINNNYYIDCKFINEIKQWIVNINIIQEIENIHFILDINKIILNYNITKNNSNVFHSTLVPQNNKSIDELIVTDTLNNKNISFFSKELYKELQEININSYINVDIDLIFIKEVFIEVNNINYLSLIFYNFKENRYNILCKNICLIVNEKMHNIYNKKILIHTKFISHIFHEIRNYLNIISLANDNITNYIKKYKKIYEDYYFNLNTNELKNSVITITDIINDFLTMNLEEQKIEKMKLENIKIKKKQFMLYDLFNNCVHTMLYKLNSKNINFEYEIKVDNILIIADYIKIKQVIVNLLLNAVKFTDKNGKINFLISLVNTKNNSSKINLEEGSVDKELYSIVNTENVKENTYLKQYIKFEINDNGCGISDEDKKNIFFNLSKNSYVTKIIVELHDGIIDFNSKLGIGSNFYFLIPLQENSSLSTSTSTSTLHPDNKEILPKVNNINLSLDKKIFSIKQNRPNTPNVPNVPNAPNAPNAPNVPNTLMQTFKNSRTYNKIFDITQHKILLVDDNIIIQKLFKKKLLDLNIKQIFIASDGEKACDIYKNEYLKNSHFTLVLMDQDMPNMNGNTSTKNILDIDKDAVIIGITGNTMIEQINNFIESGAKRVFTKPLSNENLEIILKKYYRKL